jgi:transposase-like protein
MVECPVCQNKKEIECPNCHNKEERLFVRNGTISRKKKGPEDSVKKQRWLCTVCGCSKRGKSFGLSEELLKYEVSHASPAL